MRSVEDIEKGAAAAMTAVATEFAVVDLGARVELSHRLNAEHLLAASEPPEVVFGFLIRRMLYQVVAEMMKDRMRVPGAPRVTIKVATDPDSEGASYLGVGGAIVHVEVPTAAGEMAGVDALTRALFAVIYRGSDQIEKAHATLLEHGHKAALEELRPSGISYRDLGMIR